MIYTAQIKVANRAVWGGTHSRELLIPAKIKRINGFFANVVLGDKTRLLRCHEEYLQFDESGDILYKTKTASTIEGTYDISVPDSLTRLSEQIVGAQVGSYCLSLNNTKIVVDSTPMLVVDELSKQGIVPNKIQLAEPIEVESGSFLRIIAEETLQTPFVDRQLWSTLSNLEKAQYYGVETTAVSGITPTNDYTLNIYLDYD